mmetsp:Transcript_52195/g.62835  ORF Transcript_52195/g.62835 Transcript_52195/m.62835 type:complete len:222 (-) Transcript_52195:201-866(-)|eukprot:CAMPEP_0172489782 /NCGR_PEP_ID=MMETSP1066-20121228/19998_1 /TAXON_ID=671091 /ORGANISM="Coscinodiscus wailesii, Strain CCMP2513" /LENGTH=221 /DNA_ID=CAMNT_0013257885 /DNA_START=234 /DNA_END=899 /DNA_ORIENTATION=+
MSDGEPPAWLTEDTTPMNNMDDDPPPAWLADGTPHEANEQSALSNNAITSSNNGRDIESDDTNAGLRMLRSSGHANEPQPLTSDEDDPPPRVLTIMRLLNTVAASLLVTVSVLVMISIPSDLSMWVLAVYASCGGLLVFCHEMQMKWLRGVVTNNFGFLFSPVCRFVFYVMLGSISWQYKNTFGYVVAGGMMAAGLMNLYVLCRYPQYSKMRDRFLKEGEK